MMWLAPNLYSRVGTPDPSNVDDVFSKMFSLPDRQIVRDLNGAATYLRNTPLSNGKVGVIGFCSGGRQTLLLATQSSEVDAAVDCWGGFIRTASPQEKTTPERPTPIIDMVQGIRCPVFVVIGEEDQNPSPEDGRVLEERLVPKNPINSKCIGMPGMPFLPTIALTIVRTLHLRCGMTSINFLTSTSGRR